MSVRWRTVALAAATFALVSACSGAGGDPGSRVASLGDGATSSQNAPAGDGGTDEDKQRDFIKCMQDHGVNAQEAPPPAGSAGGGGGGIAIEGGPGDEEKLREADAACRHLLPNGGKPPQLSAEDLDKMREHAKCLRENGLNVPDPDPNNPGIMVEDADPETANKAFEACKHIMGGEGPMLESKEGPK
jgi:hypothetical protein